MGFRPIVMHEWRMSYLWSPIRWWHQWQRVLPRNLVVTAWNKSACAILGHHHSLESLGTCSSCCYEVDGHEEIERGFWASLDDPASGQQ